MSEPFLFPLVATAKESFLFVLPFTPGEGALGISRDEPLKQLYFIDSVI
jgi:hypothetical protein